MAFDGFGTFIRLRSWVADATAGVKIRADFHDDEDNNLAGGLTNCIVKDGQTTITQNIPFNSKRVTALADPVNPQDAATKAYADTKLAQTGNGTITGNLGVTGNLNVTGTVSAQGYQTRTGLSGSFGGNYVNFNWTGANLEAWVDNTNLGALATQAFANTAANNAANTRVLRSGDTMTGSLNAPVFISPSGTTNALLGGEGNLPGMTLFYSPTYGATLQAWSGVANVFWPIALTGSRISVLTGDFYLHTGANRWQQDGAMYVAAQAYKPGGGSWVDSSDARIKTVHAAYAGGLAAINQLQPVTYAFKGNAALTEAQTSMHATVLDKEYIGLVAQDVEQIMPELVTKEAGYIDGQPVNDLRILDPSPLLFALINAVNELSAKVKALEAKLAAGT